MILIYSLIASLTLARASEISPPKQPLWEGILGKAVDISSREQILQLATLLPRIYGFHFLCQFTSADPQVKPFAVLPGERLSAPVGGTLLCPDHYNLELTKETRLRVQQSGSTPIFTLDAGEAALTSNNEPFFFQTPAFAVAAQGTGIEQRITFSALPQLQALDCARGSVSLTYIPNDSFKGKALLASRQCRMEIALAAGETHRYLFAGDRVAPENLLLPRRFWPAIPATALTKLSRDQADFAAFQLHPVVGVKGKMAFQMAREFDQGTCKLYGQKDEAGPLAEIGAFKAAPTGELVADPAYLPGILSAVCETGKASISSNAASTVIP